MAEYAYHSNNGNDEDLIVDEIYRSTIRYIYGEIDGEELDEAYSEYVKKSKKDRSNLTDQLIMRFQSIIEATEGTVLYYYIVSFLIHATNSVDLCKAFLRSVLNDEDIVKEELIAFFQYTSQLLFLGIIPQDRMVDELQDALYTKAFDIFDKTISIPRVHIPLEDRNKELVMIITGQMLSMEHGPTKTLLDRCYILQKFLGKQILIINTAEMSRFTTDYPLYRFRKGNYLENYNRVRMIDYKGCMFEFTQCSNDKNNDPEISKIIELVTVKKPFCIVNIGGGSIITDLCSKIVPTITIGTVPSSKAQTFGQFQTIGRKVNDDDRRWLEKHKLGKEHFIESLFTSAFKDQNHHYERNDLGLPEEGFVSILVGSRLDDEIDDQCLDMLMKLMNKGIFVAFAGRFNRFERLSKESKIFQQMAINLGFQQDMLAVLECCDICINPKRVGGGTSVAEALYKKVPVVTQNYGDGGLGAGEKFCLENYEQMHDRVMRLYEDHSFYRSMQQFAANRAEELMDSKKEFLQIMEKVTNSSAFQ